VQFSLPHQKDALREHVERRSALAQQDPSARQVRPYYIVKPDSGSQGEGIKITADPERCKPGAPGQERVVQEYIARPMLLEGLKFDLRLYVLVADIQDDDDGPRPMRLFLCREGLARFAVDPYESPSSDNVSNVHMHLTNYSLNRKADGFKVCEDPDGGYGSKRTVSSVLRALMRVGKISDPEEVWQQLESLVGRSLGVIQPVLAASRARWSPQVTRPRRAPCSTPASRVGPDFSSKPTNSRMAMKKV
jgi:tubulin polyglutamylase TTLL11